MKPDYQGAPHPILTRIAGLVMVAALFVLMTGDSPAVSEFPFETQDQDVRIQHLVEHLEEWRSSWATFGWMGAVVAAGFVLWAFATRFGGVDPRTRRLTRYSAVATVLGALAWGYACYFRATKPPAEVAAGSLGLAVSLATWCLLVMAAVGMTGWVFRRAGMRWRGLALLVFAALVAVGGILLPLIVAFPVVLTGLLLLLTPSRHWSLVTGNQQ